MTNPYYWTAFTFEGHDPNDLHCTHKFLGEQTPETGELIRKTIDAFFNSGEGWDLIAYTLNFDEPALFGKEENVPVLLADTTSQSVIERFLQLRSRLDGFRADDFPDYVPHVTCDLKTFTGRISGYVLMQGKTELNRWKPRRRLTNAKPQPELRHGDKVLAPIRETTEEFSKLEKEIIRAFRVKLFDPMLKVLGVGDRRLTNAKSDTGVKRAIETGRITFNQGEFSGKFSAAISRELKQLGATWDRKSATWRIPASLLPQEIRAAIAVSKAAWERKLNQLDAQFRQNLPAEIAEKVDSKPLFDSSLWKIDRKVDNSLESIAVLPELTPERRSKIAEEWRNNLDLWITNFAQEEIPKLRDEIQQHVMKGGRYEDVIQSLQKSFGITQRKARFLARQETGLLMAKFKETRYAEAGIHEYRWTCVAGSAKHPVRPSHKILDGKIFRFDDPPITTAPGEPVRRNNPGEDFNCRCSARPIVRGAKGQVV